MYVTFALRAVHSLRMDVNTRHMNSLFVTSILRPRVEWSESNTHTTSFHQDCVISLWTKNWTIRIIWNMLWWYKNSAAIKRLGAWMQTQERYFCSQITNVWKRNWAHHSFSIQTGPQWVLTILNNGCMELRSSPPVSTKCHARQNVQKGEVAVLKDMALCDTLGRQIHPEFCVTGPLLSAAFSPGIKLQIWAMGADRRWASRRHWREWIRECGRWQGRHAVYLTEWRGAFFFFTRMSSTAAKTQLRGNESFARTTCEASYHTSYSTELSSVAGFQVSH